MRPLTRMKVFDEVGVETYTWTPISKFLTMPSIAGGYKFMWVITLSPLITAPHLPILNSLGTEMLQVRRSSQILRPHANFPL